MWTAPVRHRRARRTDFEAVRGLLSDAALATPGTDRSDLRRFRRVVADLGADLYVTVAAGEEVIGVVHVTYARPLTGPPLAYLTELAVRSDARRHGVGRGLAAFAAARARRRGCSALRFALAGDASEARGFLAATGWRVAGEAFMLDLGDPVR